MLRRSCQSSCTSSIKRTPGPTTEGLRGLTIMMQEEGEEGEDGFEKAKSAKEKKKVSG